MKAITLIAIAILSQVSLAYAVPHAHGQHGRFHDLKRDLRTETVTVTDYSAIVWVDNKGDLISTEYKSSPQAQTSVMATPTLSPATISTQPVVSASPSTAIQSSATQPQASAAPTVQNKQVDSGGNKGSDSNAGMGICYDTIDSSSKCKDSGTISSEFAFLKSQGYGIIRVYDIGCNIGTFAAAAASNGLKLMAGLNSIVNLANDLGTMITMINGNWSPIDTIYIGNELVNNGAASAETVAAAVSTAKGILRAAGYTGNVVTVDTFNTMQNNPTICSTSDYCAANAHAYFDPNTSPGNAGDFVLNAYKAVQSANGGKRVVITETGWPWKGNCNGIACPGIDAQKQAMNSVIQAFSGQASNVFLFQAYDAGYKQPGTLGVEQYFGIYDTDHYTGGIGS